MLKDPEGAYSQLIRLQEANRESVGDELREGDINTESFRESGSRKSLKRSISRGSSGTGHSSRRSFTVSFGLPTGVGYVDSPRADVESHTAESSNKAPKVSIRRLAALNKPEIPVLIFGSIAAIANGLILPTYGLLISHVIQSFYKPPHELRKDTRFWALIFMALGLGSFLVIPFQQYFFSVAGGRLIKRIRSLCFEKVVHMEVGWFDEPENSSGAIGARLSADAASIRALVGDALAQLVQNTASAVAGLVIAFIASWELALIVLVIIPLIGVNGYVQIKFLKGFSADAKVCLNEN